MPDYYSLVLYLLFDKTFDLNGERIRDELIKSMTPKRLGFVPGKQPHIEASTAAQTSSGSVLDLKFDDHEIQLVMLNVPMPTEAYAQPLQAAHLRPEHKQLLQSHKSHVIAYYRGHSSDMVEQFIAIHRVANACAAQGLIGTINPLTWMCLITPMLGETLKPDFIEAFRKSPASGLLLWVGFVKFFKSSQETWYATRGNTLFGIPEFAYLGDQSEANAAVDMFGTLISYVHDTKAQLAHGHTIQLPGEIYLRFGQVSEFSEYLGSDTLVLERINPSEINQ